jgi:hypothetical protein
MLHKKSTFRRKICERCEADTACPFYLSKAHMLPAVPEAIPLIRLPPVPPSPILPQATWRKTHISEGISSLRSQFATSNEGHGGRRYKPYAFTEHGAIMAAGVLNSARAVQTSIFVVRAFVRLRRLLESDQELATRLDHVERMLGDHDRQIVAIVDAIELLMPPPPEEEPPREPFGFRRVKKN